MTGDLITHLSELRGALQALVRYSLEVQTCFKSTGEGWQSLMDSVLRQYVTAIQGSFKG